MSVLAIFVKIKVKMQSKKKILSRSLRLMTKSCGGETIVNAIILVIRSFIPLAALLLIRYYVDRLTGPEGNDHASSMISVIWLIIAVALTVLADDLLSYAGNYFTRRQSFKAEGYISSLIHEHASGLGLKFFEDPLFHDGLARAEKDISWRPAALVSDLILLLRGVISFMVTGYILRNLGLLPLAVLLIVFIPVLWIRARNSSRLYKIRKKVTADSRQASYFSWLLTGERPAREVRLFNLGDYFGKLFKKYFRASRQPEIEAVKKNSVAEALTSLIKAVAFAGILFYATASFLKREITAGELAMYVVAFRQALVYLRDAVSGLSGLAENRLFLQDLFRFLDLKDDMEGKEKVPEAASFADITVKNLTFTYPGALKPALHDINLKIRRGEKIAVVGPNGSGKTTLVRLLCRLYDPDKGSVLLNGKEITTIDPVSYRKLFSVVFQNFMLYFLTVGDNIRLGNTGKQNAGENEEMLRKAAAMTGLDELIEGLGHGYDTLLGHHTEGGRELSWGEWQKIAIARALYRDAPVLILDEPASSLDADSEYEIFSDLGRITEGRTCIFISHRLSHVKDADRIIVLDAGKIAETGTHEELMAAGGRYFNMFSRQRSLYS